MLSSNPPYSLYIRGIALLFCPDENLIFAFSFFPSVKMQVKGMYLVGKIYHGYRLEEGSRQKRLSPYTYENKNGW
jgi:hypothetical protein